MARQRPQLGRRVAHGPQRETSPAMALDGGNCIVFNWKFAAALAVMTSVNDAIYFLHMLLQVGTRWNACDIWPYGRFGLQLYYVFITCDFIRYSSFQAHTLFPECRFVTPEVAMCILHSRAAAVNPELDMEVGHINKRALVSCLGTMTTVQVHTVYQVHAHTVLGGKDKTHHFNFKTGCSKEMN